ncbi:DUF3488 and transglutaminase-like domain-containing protein [Streptomyces sp. T028]|uniref:DUF3488 and transglutaminase-like domain-containing protein n=1 Tax=Streptomyces sp. T028 TaxID=3394379 RepID=UPI003A8608C0
MSIPTRTTPLPAAGDGPRWDWAPAPPTAPRPAERPQAVRASAAAGELGRARRLWSLLPVAALCGASGYGFARVFPPADLLPVLAVAVLAPILLSALLSGLLGPRAGASGRPATALWPSLVLTVVAWAVVVSATLFRDASGGLPGGTALRAAWTSLLDAPHALLSTILPAPADPELLVLPHAVVWPAAFAAAELALRTRAPLLPALPPVLAFGFPLVLGVDGPGSLYPAVGALAGATALLVLVRSRTRLPLRTMALRLPVVAALALVAALLGPHLPGLGAPYDPREAVTPPTVRPQSTSPLDQVAVWTRNGDEKVFTVRTAGTTPGNYRLAVLDTYDGTTWTSGAELTPTGGRVPAEKNVRPGTTRTLEQRFTVQSLPGIWLPAADRPTTVRMPGDTALAVDPDSAVLSTGQALPSGFTYTVTSHIPVYDAARLQYAAAAHDPARVALPDIDAAGQPIPSVPSFRKIAEQATKGSTYPYQQAGRLADWLRGNYQLDPDALPGHTYRGLEFFLADGRRGTSEQFAASFAVLARTLGLPTRVAVGFRSGQRTGSGAWQIHGRDVLAWPEVEFSGVGWVPFYPTPGEATQGGSVVPPAGEPKEREQVDREISGGARPSTPPRTTREGDSATAATPGSGPPAWLWAPLGVLLLATAYVLYALWLPHRLRRRRRTDPDARRRVRGAWQQIVERLTETGLPTTGAHTAQEVAAFGAARVGGPVGGRLPALAALVNEVDYAGRTPDAAAADAAWADCDAIEKTVLRSVPRRTRLRRLLHPAAVWRGRTRGGSR